MFLDKMFGNMFALPVMVTSCEVIPTCNRWIICPSNKQVHIRKSLVKIYKSTSIYKILKTLFNLVGAFGR